MTEKPNPLKRSFGFLGSVPCQFLDANDQRVVKKYVQSNSESCALLKAGFFKQALEILENSQRNFMQMRENNQNIDELLLAATIHNLSATHYGLGNIHKSLDYVRLLLYNLNNRILQVQKQNNFEYSLFSFNMDIKIAKYYLYFLSLTIQLKMHEAAVVPSNRAMQFFKKFCKDYRKSELSLQLINKRMTQKLFFEIEQFQSLRNNTSEWELMENLKQTFSKVKNLPNHSLDLFKLKKFSVVSMTKINQLEIHIKDGKIVQKYPGKSSFEDELVEFPLCLFLIGKSLLESNISKTRKQVLSQRIFLIDKTKQYILWSLYFLCELCPYFTPMHKDFFDYYEAKFHYQQNDSINNIQKTNKLVSLQTPSLKDSVTWRDIKKKKIALQKQTNKSLSQEMEIQTKQDRIPIVNEKQFLQKITSQRQKVTNNQTVTLKKRLYKHSSQQVLKSEKILWNDKQKKKNINYKKEVYPNLRAREDFEEPQKGRKRKKESETKKGFKNASMSAQSIKLGGTKLKQIKTQKHFAEFIEQYFPKFPSNKKKQINGRISQAIDDFNLKKKNRKNIKSLSLRKKNILGKTTKKIS